MNKRIWYKKNLEKDDSVFGPFESTYDLICHYSTCLLKWDIKKLNYTEFYFKQVYNKSYFDFLIEKKHIVVFEKENI